MNVLAEGWWCTDCKFFEMKGDMTSNGCLACGCPMPRHLQVQVKEVENA